MNLHQDSKNQGISSISSGDIVDKQNPATWLAENILALYLGKKFSQIEDLCRNTENNIYFHYRTISVNINTKFFNKLKKTLFLAHFWNIFPIFGADRILLKNLALSRTTSYSFLVLCQNLEKNNNTILRKRPDRRKDKRKDRKTYRPCFIGSFWLPLVVQQGQLHWNTFKSQRYREGYWSNQKLLDYCQHAKNLLNT